MKHLLLFSALLLLPFSVIASSLPAPGNWSGAVGTATVAPLPGELPGEAWESVRGSLVLKISPPSSKAPNGSYSAVFSVFEGGALQVFRGKGSLGEQGRLAASWSGPGKSPRRCEIDLVFSSSPDGLLQGTANVIAPAETFTDTNGNSQRDTNEVFVDANKNGSWDAGGLSSFAVFALRSPYGKSAPLPADVAGSLSALCLAEGADLPLGIFSGGIDTAGRLKLGGTWQDGRKASLSTAVLRFDNSNFVVPAAALGKGIFLGARAVYAPGSGGSDWSGKAWEFKTTGAPRPLRFEGFRAGNNAALNWPTGAADLYLEHGLDVEYANGVARIVQRSNKLALEGIASNPGIRDISLSFFPSEALVKGSLTYIVSNSNPETRATVAVSGVLNPSTGEVRGRVGSIGWFSLVPLRD